MKCIHHIILILILVFVSCSKEVIKSEVSQDDVAFSSSATPDSKVSYEEGRDAVRLSWTKDDRIGIYSSFSGNTYAANVTYLAEESAPVTTLVFASPATRIKWKDDNKPHDFYAYYPYSGFAGENPYEISLSLPSVQKQNGLNNNGHAAMYDFMWANVKQATKSGNPVKFAFNHIFSIIDLNVEINGKVIVDRVIFRIKGDDKSALAFSDGRFDLDKGNLDLSKATISSEVCVDCGFTFSPGLQNHVYAVINPGHEGKTVEIALVINGEEKILCEKAVPVGGFPAGKYVTTTASYSTSAEELVEIKDLSAVETSNCYIVNKPGAAYKFKANVKGNGFVPPELATVVTNTDINPQSVLVLWYNTVQTNSDWVDACPVDISSVCIVDGYVHFDTPKTFVNGNLVMVCFEEPGITYDNIQVDSQGNIANANILWSWNIWAVEDMDIDSESIKVTYTAEDNSRTEFTVMDRNLGALINGKILDASDKDGYLSAAALGNYYQWGRKDPFPPIADYGNYWPLGFSNKLLATPTYTPIKALQKVAEGGVNSPERQLFVMDYDKMQTQGAPALETCLYKFDKAIFDFGRAINEAEKYPYKHFRGADTHMYDKHWFPNDPEKDPWKYLWGDFDVNDGVAIQKTLYDPCPAGWVLWQEETIDAFVQQGAATASIAPDKNGLMVAGSYFGYNGGGRQEDMSFEYGTPFQICGYPCPIALIGGTASDRYFHKILRNVVWKSPSQDATSKIIVESSDINGSNPKRSMGYSVRCIKTK